MWDYVLRPKITLFQAEETPIKLKTMESMTIKLAPVYDTMSDLLVKYDKIDLTLTATDPAAQSCYEAAAFVGRENEIYFTGWDYYADYKQSMIDSEQFYGTVACLPYYMGKVAAYALFSAVSDPQFLQLWIDVEYPVITHDNMDVYEPL